MSDWTEGTVVQDDSPPQVLFSLKIVPTMNCSGFFCTPNSMMPTSSVNLKIENLSSPPSAVSNSIGFQTLKAGYTTVSGNIFPTDYTLTGTMTSPSRMRVWLTARVCCAQIRSGHSEHDSRAGDSGLLGTEAASIPLELGIPALRFAGYRRQFEDGSVRVVTSWSWRGGMDC